MNQTLSVMVSGAKSFCVSAGKKIKGVVMDPRFVAVMLLLVVCTVAVDAINRRPEKVHPCRNEAMLCFGRYRRCYRFHLRLHQDEQRGAGCQEEHHDDCRCLHLPRGGSPGIATVLRTLRRRIWQQSKATIPITRYSRGFKSLLNFWAFEEDTLCGPLSPLAEVCCHS